MIEPVPAPSIIPQPQPAQPRRVAIVGGGLAGLAAAVGLAGQIIDGQPLSIELIEARRRLGGRAASFADAASGEAVDYCQHISMGCCTNLADFCRRTGTADLFRADRVLNLFTRDGRCSRLSGVPLLPAPLHLAPALLRLHFLSWKERFAIGRAMLQLARAKPETLAECTVSQWLAAHGQTPRAIERFWGAVLVSALGESVDRSSMLHAQKVFVDAYLSNSKAYELHVPRVSLSELYDVRLTEWLAQQQVKLTLGTPVDMIDLANDGITLTSGATTQEYDAVIVAVPWQRVSSLLAPRLAALPEVAGLQQIDAAPIAGVHLWFDRQITTLEHAAMVDMLSQWLFRRTDLDAGQQGGEFYYQVVISASRHIAGRDRAEVVAEICNELRDVFPAARDAKLLRWKMVADPLAVFSVRPGIEELRPTQKTSIAGLYLAGDWTKTGWPSTMEGAVRSGYLAAESVLQRFNASVELLTPDLPRGALARMLRRA
ncbi:MAG TPA: hydroxysqualene dehydroxylase HpnE [Pirellulales bacterium]|jgi:squalene-associated FAD-dependent desaturase